MARWICQSKSDNISEITRVSGTSEIEIQQLKLKLWAGRRLEAQLWAGKMERVWRSAVICRRSLNPKWQVWSMSGALLNMVRKLTKFIALCVKPPGKGINSHLVFKTGLTSHIWKLQESFIWHLARRMNLSEHWKRSLRICIELWLSNGSRIYFNI